MEVRDEIECIKSREWAEEWPRLGEWAARRKKKGRGENVRKWDEIETSCECGRGQMDDGRDEDNEIKGEKEENK